MLIALIISIVAAIGLPVLVYKVQKHFADKKKKELQDKLDIQDKQIKGLEAEKKQRIREQKAGIEHRKRVQLTRIESAKIGKQIDQAHTDDEIMAIIAMIDEDNNFKVRPK